jgi:RsmE family RNA methyltransferase
VNWILLEPAEIPSDGAPVRLRGEAARHALSILKATPGKRLRLGIVDGPLGTGEVLETGPGELLLQPQWESAPPPRPRIDLLLAMPRPKVMRRLWPVLASLGVGRIFVTNAWKVERGYFDTPALDPDAIRAGLLEGLRQAGDTRVPEVTIHRRLRPLVEDILPALPYARRWISHPEPNAPLAFSSLPYTSRTLLAVGPEGGWIPDEIDLFRRHGFVPLSLGPRILRTDTACTVLLGLLHAAGA